jgi:hypothetical protein
VGSQHCGLACLARNAASLVERPGTPLAVRTLAGGYWQDAQNEFVRFRKLMRPKMLENWWTDALAEAMQQFYADLVAGKRPNLAIGAPPQHGKSWAATDFISWVAGKNPDLKIIFASYSDDLGMRTNLDLQRLFEMPQYQRTFPDTRIGEAGWTRNSSLLEFAKHSGSFRNTTINGSINGMELHLGVIDDPIKGRAEVQGKGNRDKVWHWFTDDWGSRFSKDAGMLIIMTRWHVDDLLGRFIERTGKDVKVLNFPAIADVEEPNRKVGEEAHPTVPQRLLNAQQRSIFAGALGRTRADCVPQTRKSSHGMFRIIVVPRHAVVIEECEQFVPVLFNSLLERKPDLRCAFHGDDVLDESCGRFPVLAQMSRLQAIRVYSLDDLSEHRAKSPGDLLQLVIEGVPM